MLGRFPLTETFDRACEERGFDTPEAAAYQALWYPTKLSVADGKKHTKLVKWIPSTRIGDGQPGPRQHYELAVIGKMPGNDEIDQNRVLVGPTGRCLLDSAEVCGCRELIENAYGSNAVRFQPPDGGKSLKPTHVKDCMPLLAQELAYVRPEWLLLLGTDAVKAFFGSKMSLSKVRSKCFVLPDIYHMGQAPLDAASVSEEQFANGVKIYATIHPAAVLREVGLMAGLESDLTRFKGIYRGSISAQAVAGEADRDYRYVHTYEGLKAVVDEVLASGAKELSIDCEWGGTFPTGQLRTIQFCWGRRKACVVILRRRYMYDAQSYAERSSMMLELKRLFHAEGMGIFGHHIRADAKWLALEDLPVMERVNFDTMLADHILNENAEHRLEECTVRYTDMGRYDWKIKDWLIKNPQDKEDGFAEVPDDILHPYAACDVDATWRCKEVLSETLRRPESGGPARCFYQIVMPCTLPIHEIEMKGLMADTEMMEQLVWAYDTKKRELIALLRDLVGKESFNFRSFQQVSHLLFAPTHKGGLELTPLKTTEGPARMWEDIQDLPEDELRRLNPSTDAETLKYLASEHPRIPIVKVLADLRLIDQVSKSFMRTPEVDPVTGDEVYDSGLVGQVDPDGRVRTNLNQMSETGRWKSSDPNLQNLPNRQEPELERVMGEGVPKIRTAFIAKDGCVLIEADFASAEIFSLACLSNCKKLLRDAASDLHARGAVNYFGAAKWDGFDEFIKPDDLWKSKYGHLRVAAKTVNFGIPYQRGAKAVAREIVKSTDGAIMCTADMAQGYIDGFYDTYPEVDVFVSMCKAAVLYPGYLELPSGRRRRFASYADESTIAAQQREAVNFPIQGTVADLLNVAAYNLWMWRRMYPGEAEYDICLGVHDAVFLEVPGTYVPVVTERVLPECMKHGAVVPPWLPAVFELDGRGKPIFDKPFYTRPTEPFCLDIDIEVMIRWKGKPDPEAFKRRGVPAEWIEAHVKS